MPVAYSYLRFSSPEQAKGDSSRRQNDKAVKYAAEHGLDLDESLKMNDEGVPAYRGVNASTGYLGEFLQKIEAGSVEKGSYLLIESLDRLSRDFMIDAQQIMSKIIYAGIIIVTLKDKRVYSLELARNNPFLMLEAAIVMIRANEESAMKEHRVRDAWSQKRKKIADKPLTAKAPAWLRLDKEQGEFQIIDERAKLVRRIFHMYLNGTGPGTIAKRINQEGVLPWGSGSQWYVSYVNKILRNPAVCGIFTPHTLEYIVYNEKRKKQRMPQGEIQNYFPAVIDMDTFLAAQELRTTKGITGRKITSPLQNSPLQNIFSRLSKCPVCGASMIYVNKGKTWQYLACSAAKGGAGLCKYRAVSYDRLEHSFLEAVRSGLVIPVEGEKLRSIETELTEAESRMNDYIRQRGNLIEAIKNGVLRHDTVTMDSVPVNVLTGKVEEGAVYTSKNVPFTLGDEIKLLDISVEANRKIIVQLRCQLNLLRPAVVEERVKDLERVTRGNELDKKRINAVLRMICNKVVIQYDTDTIEMHFKHTDLPLSVPVKLRGAA